MKTDTSSQNRATLRLEKAISSSARTGKLLRISLRYSKSYVVVHTTGDIQKWQRVYERPMNAPRRRDSHQKTGTRVSS